MCVPLSVRIIFYSHKQMVLVECGNVYRQHSWNNVKIEPKYCKYLSVLNAHNLQHLIHVTFDRQMDENSSNNTHATPNNKK